MELLAPAGNWDSFIAAMENGADAVYLGGQRFSARQYAGNFDDNQISQAIEYAHLRKRKVYIAVNTLIDCLEFEAVLDYVYSLYNMGVDALIVQDLGLMNAIRTLIPDMRLHASTQMTIHNAAGAALLHEQGIARVVLAREMSREEIGLICTEVDNMEFEVFVHGALCYSFSGQCLFSSMVGGRSGNRGRCAQPCRLPYQLCSYSTAAPAASAERGKYLISPADLCLIEHLQDIKDSGVKSLKIEGRMKRPEYVAVVTKAYREALNELEANPGKEVSPELKKRLFKIFNRNFTTGYFDLDKAGFLSSKKPNNRGVYIGRVLEQKVDFTTLIRLTETVNLGDGLEIWVKKGKGPAFIIKNMEVDGKKVDSAGAGELVKIKIDGRAGVGDRVFKTHDVEVIDAAMQTIKAGSNLKIPVDIEACLKKGQPLRLVFTDERGNCVEAWSDNLAVSAEKYALSHEVLREKIDKLGNTAFNLRKFSLDGDENLMIPFSDINHTRRRGIAQLLQLNLGHPDFPGVDARNYHIEKKKYLAAVTTKVKRRIKLPVLSISVSGLEQARSALKAGAGRVYLNLQGIGRKQSINDDELKALIELAAQNNQELVPALPRIQKPGDRPLNTHLNINMPGSVMVGNLGSLKNQQKHKRKFRIDYSLNIFNPWAVKFLLELGAEGVCLSPELNFKQLQSFNNIDKVEMLVHGEIILMVSEHCILASILGDPKEKCSVHCARDNYFLKDDRGYEFPVLTDNVCRFYLFNSRTLCMMEDLKQILSLGPESIRIEAHRADNNQIALMVALYREAMDRIIKGQKTDLGVYQEELARTSLSPFTKGHYYRGVL